MNKGKGKLRGALPNITRPHLTATVAEHTLSKVDDIVRLTGMSKGQVVDLALDAIEVCPACQGHGRLVGEPGREEEARIPREGESGRRCYECSGYRIVPSSRITLARGS